MKLSSQEHIPRTKSWMISQETNQIVDVRLHTSHSHRVSIFRSWRIFYYYNEKLKASHPKDDEILQQSWLLAKIFSGTRLTFNNLYFFVTQLNHEVCYWYFNFDKLQSRIVYHMGTIISSPTTTDESIHWNILWIKTFKSSSFFLRIDMAEK